MPRPVAITRANMSLDSFAKESSVQGSKVPITDQSFPSSPIKKTDVPQFRYSAPEIQPFPVQSKKVDKLLNDRQQVSRIT